MTDKVTLNPVVSFVNDSSAALAVNTSLTTLTTAFNNTLSRDGTSPNQMEADLDMNSFNIINLPTPASLDSPARVRDIVSNPTLSVPTTGTSNHTVPYLDGDNTWSGTNAYSAATTFDGAVTLNGATDAVTQVSSDSSTKVATTAFVQSVAPGGNTAGLSVLGVTGTVAAPAVAITGTANKFLGVNSAGTSLSFETMSGDATLASGVLTLATANASPGSYGSSTAIPTVTVDAKGRTTAVTTNAVVAPAGTLSGTTLKSTVVNSSLANVSNALELGADSATPATATVYGQDVLAGTNNQPGTTLYVAGSRGTGTGAGGKVVVRTAPAGSTGTTKNSLVDRMTVDAPGNVVVGSSPLATNATDGFLYIPSCAGPPTGAPTVYGNSCPLVYDTTNNKLYTYNSVSTTWKSVTLA